MIEVKWYGIKTFIPVYVNNERIIGVKNEI